MFWGQSCLFSSLNGEKKKSLVLSLCEQKGLFNFPWAVSLFQKWFISHQCVTIQRDVPHLHPVTRFCKTGVGHKRSVTRWVLRVAVKMRSWSRSVVFFSFSLPLRNCPPFPQPVDLAIDSCGFHDAIPHFTATERSTKLGYVTSKRKHFFIGCCVVLLVQCGFKMRRNGWKVK